MTSDAGSEPSAGDVCGALSGILRDGVDIHRCLAAQALGRIGQPAAVGPLMEALLDEDEDVRTDAAGALAALADPRAATQLLENLLGDPCIDVKLAAIEALVRLRSRDLIPWLRRMVKGRDEDIAWDEAEFLDSGWDGWVDIQIKAIEALAELGAGEAVPDITQAMEDEHGQDVSETAFPALARMGGPGIEALADFLDHKDDRLRRRAAAALAGCDDDIAAAPLTRALEDPSPEVRMAAARPLAARNPVDERLAFLFEDADAGVRAEAARLSGSHHPARLEPLLDDDAGAVQEAALKALADMPGAGGASGLADRIRPKLESPSPELAAAAAVALAAIAPETALGDLARLLRHGERPLEARLGALRGLAGIGGEPAARALADVTGDEQRLIRLESLAALAALAHSLEQWPNPAGEALISALRGDPKTAGEADAVGERADQSGHPRGEPAETKSPASGSGEGEGPDAEAAYPTSTLHSILGGCSPAAEIVDLPDEGVELTPDDMERLALARSMPRKRRVPVMPRVAPRRDLRRLAARVLGNSARSEVALELALVLKDGDREMRLAAADSLARIGERLQALPDAAVESLLAALPGADREQRLFIIRALAWGNDDRIDKVLETHLGDEDSFVRAEAVRALSRLGTDAGFGALLGDSDPGVRLAAARAVADARGPKAVDLLVEFAFSFEGYHRREAGRLLRDLDAARANARFLGVLGDGKRLRSWPVAIEALEELNRFDPSLDEEAGAGTPRAHEYERENP
ncbi:MAG: HEAT repeat domain-containing protein [Proteobacteria bacterium]|nr:HEAT repeat domain-containing protein [Pseudomonadota bacterium]